MNALAGGPRIDVEEFDAGRNPRPRRLDLQIAATAAAHDLVLVTRSPVDFIGLDSLIKVITPPG